VLTWDREGVRFRFLCFIDRGTDRSSALGCNKGVYVQDSFQTLFAILVAEWTVCADLQARLRSGNIS